MHRTSYRARAVSCLLACAFSGLWVAAWYQAVPVAAQVDLRIWDGVYTAAQARRGAVAYDSYCVNCHGGDLLGAGRTDRALTGDHFWASWEASRLTNLFEKVKSTMPRDNPSSLANTVYVDLIAFILETNAFPSGEIALQANAELDAIRILRQGATSALPNFALVEVVGCLTQRPDSRWELTNATDPVLTVTDTPSASELRDAESRQLGRETLRLLGITRFNPELYEGHKMNVRGVIDTTPNDRRLDLASLQLVSSTCAN